ncbi:uncharacterized protein LOC122082233 [Macadamia integrifolia]|uniref:uncharacterized protein LOC122082233 n=1 Tax=Macadamia integrifolia TaxID=60698 RepID=UPI001C4F4F76|nr:uncharacterized protein LOC122082233 [Macadamia integrifolia]
MRPGENHPECPISDPSSSSDDTSSSQGSDDSSGSNDSSGSGSSLGSESVEVVSPETVPSRARSGSTALAQPPSAAAAAGSERNAGYVQEDVLGKSHTSGWYYFNKRERDSPYSDLKMFLNMPSSVKKWKERYFYVAMEGNPFKSRWVKPTQSVLNRAPKLSPTDLQTYQMCLGGEAVDVCMLQNEDFLQEFGLSEVPVVNVKVDNKALAAAAAEARKKDTADQAAKKAVDKGKAAASPNPNVKVAPPTGAGNKSSPLIIGGKQGKEMPPPIQYSARHRAPGSVKAKEPAGAIKKAPGQTGTPDQAGAGSNVQKRRRSPVDEGQQGNPPKVARTGKQPADPWVDLLENGTILDPSATQT